MIETELAIRMKLRTDMADPSSTNERIEQAEPNLEWARSDIELPTWELWITDNLCTEPTWHKPINEVDEPSRMKFLKDNVDPRCTASRTDKALMFCETPLTERQDPRLT
jgi:hypothetical protein